LSDGRLGTIQGTHHQTEQKYKILRNAASVKFKWSDIEAGLQLAGWAWEQSTPKDKSCTNNRQNSTLNWNAIHEHIAGNVGNVTGMLVERYMPGAVETCTGWKCRSIAGGTPVTRHGGSFSIPQDGLCRDFDGSYEPSGLAAAIFSPERAAETGE
jgi:hypothetical protein